MTTPIVENAPAKLNLYLHVLGKRPDGYHRLDSLIVFADIGDTVTAHTSPARIALRGVELPPTGPRLIMSGPFSQVLLGEPPQSNLVLRTAHALAARLGREPEAILALDKRLPVASGIGGGSADAAATIRALATLWGIDPEAPALWEVAASLGADVPVCLAARPCFIGGAGERIVEAPPLPPAWVVLVNPGVGVSTPQVFKARHGDFSQPARFEGTPLDLDILAAWLRTETRNDLTTAATFLCPVINPIMDALAGQPGSLLARMSGSGATCFALFAEEGAARAAAAQIALNEPGWWVKAAAMLPRPAIAPPLPDAAWLASLPTGDAATPGPPPVPFPDTGGWGVG